MARLTMIVKNEKRRKWADKQRPMRVELRKKIKNPKTSDEERGEALAKLQSLPRNAADCRVRNRCEVSGRSRGFYRKFKLSRIAFRDLALKGMVPGVTKSSW